MTTLIWQKEDVTDDLIPLLTTLGTEYPIVENGTDGIKLQFEKQAEGLDIRVDNKVATIKYSTISAAARGIGKVLSEPVETTVEISEKCAFDTFGFLIDCSRNATFRIDYFKKYLRRLALMGYNMAMLYTKDAYELPEEDFFGYLRGRYKLEELQELDAYAATLGIEMIGSVQALGHLEPTLQWPAYAAVKDTSSVILTSEEKSYVLIRKILEFWSQAFKSRRIHLGMDETHDLGRGRFMDLNGYKRGYDIYNDHLKRVAADCEELNLEPIIWSDMFFRMGSKTAYYYDKDLVIPADIKDDIPDSIELCYWDYYHDNEAFYREWIRRHRDDLDHEPSMASALWSWLLFWHNHDKTVQTAVPCIDACIRDGVKDFYFTVWADDGTICNLESILAGACSMAEKIYSKTAEMNEDNAQKLFDTVCKSSYLAHKAMSDMTVMRNINGDNIYECSNAFEAIDARAILWDDPLLQIYRKNQLLGNSNWSVNTINHFKQIAAKVADVPDSDEACFSYGKTLLSLLIHKLELLDKLDDAYAEKNSEKLQQAAALIPAIQAEIEDFLLTFRSYQYERYNPQGFELFHIRLGGQKERFREIELRISELISGKTEAIPELDEKASNYSVKTQYSALATASYFV